LRGGGHDLVIRLSWAASARIVMTGIPLDASPGISVVGSTVRIRWSRRQAMAALWPVVIIGTVMAMFSVHSTLRVRLAIAVALLAVVTRLTTMRWGTDLTPSHLVSRWGRRRAIPWDRVQGFKVQQAFGSRTLEVVSDDGQCRELWAPRSSWFIGRATFEAQHRFIGQWWVDHRGALWEPLLSARGLPPDASDFDLAELPGLADPAGRSGFGVGVPGPLRDNPWIRPGRSG
jgi:hypothetical protein